jgi:hypothetical protein
VKWHWTKEDIRTLKALAREDKDHRNWPVQEGTYRVTFATA